jgi:hypothetical protein
VTTVPSSSNPVWEKQEYGMAQLKLPPSRTAPSRRPPPRSQSPTRAAFREGMIAGIAIAAVDLVAVYQIQSAGPESAPATAISLLDLLATIVLIQLAGYRAGSAAYDPDAEPPSRLLPTVLLSSSSLAGLGAGALAGAVAGILNSVHLLLFPTGRFLQEPVGMAGELITLVLMNLVLGALFGFSSGWLAGLVRRTAQR